MSLKESILKAQCGGCSAGPARGRKSMLQIWHLKTDISVFWSRPERVYYGAAICLVSWVSQRCLPLLTSTICSWRIWTFCSIASASSRSSRSWDSLLIMNNKSWFLLTRGERKKNWLTLKPVTDYFWRSSSSFWLFSLWSHSLYIILDASILAMFFSIWDICWNQMNKASHTNSYMPTLL